MLGEESHKDTLDSSAGDNRVVCTVIYTAWHRKVSSTFKEASWLPWQTMSAFPVEIKFQSFPPRRLWGPHYLFSIQLEIIKSSSKHMPEGTGHFINKWRPKDTMAFITVSYRGMCWSSLLEFFLPTLPLPELGAASHCRLWNWTGRGIDSPPSHLQAQAPAIHTGPLRHSSLREKDSQVQRCWK